MSDSANREFVRAIYVAAAAGDVGTLFAAMAPVVIALGSVVWRGLGGDQEIEMPLADAWEIREGKAISLRRFFFDTGALMAGTSS
jgi:ketosteroid isomerase-like protein